jgi:glutaredoxin
MKAKAQVLLYTKPGCHLCEEAKGEMLSAGCADLYDLTEINIETDPALKTRYRFDIPVITINGQERFRHRLTAAEFKRAVASDE